MEYITGKRLLSTPISMNVVKMLSKIHENKGYQLVYTKQPKDILEKLVENALLQFTIDSYEGLLVDEENIKKIFFNEVQSKTRDEVSIIEFRDILKTVNNAYEDMKINSQTILELHGYLRRFSLVRGGRYRSEENTLSHVDFFKEDSINNHGILIRKNIEERLDSHIENLCAEYNSLIQENEIETLTIIACFIMDFILISPFEEDNIKMAKLLTILLLNKNGYEIGKYISLGNIYDEKIETYYKGLFNRKNDREKFNYAVNKWLEYFASFILDAYKQLAEELDLTTFRKETKTKRIEKIVNSTLGYFTKDDIRVQCPDIPEPTINRVFNNLRKSGKIEVVAKGRSAKWKRI